MNSNPIDQTIKQHYNNKRLAPEVLARMVLMAGTVEQGKQNKGKERLWHKRWLFQRNISLAAAVVIILLALPLLWKPSDTLMARVAQEVALNHNKQLASEYVSGSYQALASAMKNLDFELTLPVRLKKAEHQIIGARYCSIQGNIAAQVKLKNKNGEMLTLYETRLNSELAALDKMSHTKNNVNIQTWHEEGVFFSLASSMAQ